MRQGLDSDDAPDAPKCGAHVNMRARTLLAAAASLAWPNRFLCIRSELLPGLSGRKAAGEADAYHNRGGADAETPTKHRDQVVEHLTPATTNEQFKSAKVFRFLLNVRWVKRSSVYASRKRTETEYQEIESNGAICLHQFSITVRIVLLMRDKRLGEDRAHSR